jgi:hypothetical protein
MRWVLLVSICIALAFLPWARIFKALKPYFLRLAIGLGLAALIVFLTYHFGPLKLL